MRTLGEQEDFLTKEIIGKAIAIHRTLGPGLLESAYQAALAYELNQRGYKVEQQKPLPMLYKEIKLDAGYRLDFLVNRKVIVEIKSSGGIIPIHDAQILSYLRISGCKTGSLLNFNVKLLKNGIKRFVNGSLD